ncbi:hypothetical protein [Methanohalobium sp.]|uniref:hypothetical protein n=1 Tax=Methanohalobium sp. TaxID=2837493 RepID=UPI0025D94ABE|nr:hypothetical protein [Methanohalobium sp.]
MKGLEMNTKISKMTDGELMIYAGKGGDAVNWARKELERRKEMRRKTMMEK